MDESKRQLDSSPVEQSVGRALRDTLPLVQHTANELGHAIEDLVSACGSRRPSNTMPSMLRAQTAASALAAMLESLLRLVALATQPPRQTPAEELISRAISTPAAEPQPMPQAPPREVPVPMSSMSPSVIEMPAPARTREDEVAVEPEHEPPAPRRPSFEPGLAVTEEAAYEAPPPEVMPAVVEEVSQVSASIQAAPVQVAEPPAPAPEETQEVAAPAFTVESLPGDQQELHRRANRHAKVSMQDIRLLRPKEVTIGKEKKDLCTRLKNDLDKARKEYVRRFQPILEHPVDYFHHWAVEILAEGNAEALGEYPYPTPVNRH